LLEHYAHLVPTERRLRELWRDQRGWEASRPRRPH
jgi:hypothetical protein